MGVDDITKDDREGEGEVVQGECGGECLSSCGVTETVEKDVFDVILWR